MTQLILAYTLIFVGLLLLTAELILFTSGVLAMLGLAAMIVGGVVLYAADAPLAIATLLVSFVVLPILGRLLAKAWPGSFFGRRFILQPPADRSTVADTPQAHELERLRGRSGKTLTPLRPAGTVDFDGRRVDAMSEGEWIDANRPVRCIEVRAAIIVVRPVEGASPTNLEEMKL